MNYKNTACLLAVLALTGIHKAAAQTDEFGTPTAKPAAPAVTAAVRAAGTIPQDQIPVANTDKVLCKTFLGAEVTPRQQAALLYLLKNTDEETFVRGVSYGNTTASEFSSDNTSEADKNTAALAWAHNVLNGAQDIPVTMGINLFRYNLDNKSFITDATAHNLELSLGYGGFNLNPIQNGVLSGIVIHHWDQFSSIVMAPEDAISLSKALGTPRQIVVFGHVRLRPESRKIVNGNQTEYDADLRDYKLGSLDDVISEGYTDKMAAKPYVRTDAEIAFGKQNEHKAYLSPNEIIMFLDDGTVFSGGYASQQIQSKVQGLANAGMGHWYITNGSVFFSFKAWNGYNNYMKTFVIEGDTIRFNGIPYVLDPHLQLNGTKISYR